MIKKIIFSIAMFSSLYSLCMDGMEAIKEYKDVKKFVGKLVTYTTTSDYLVANEGIHEHLNFAILKNYPRGILCDDTGVIMVRLIKRNEEQRGCVLVRSNVKNANLKMRLSNKAEIEMIKREVRQGNAILERTLIPQDDLNLIKASI